MTSFFTKRRWVVFGQSNRVVLPTLENLSVDHVITDPPYSPRVHGRLGKEDRSDGQGARDALTFAALDDGTVDWCASEFVRVCKRWMLIFTDEMNVAPWAEQVDSYGGEYIRKGTWVKIGPMPQMSGDRPAVGTEDIVICHGWRPPRREKNTNARPRLRWNGGGQAAVWTYNAQDGQEHIHPTQKPLALMMKLVELFTEPDDIVLDPFCGSGSTGVACLRLGRRFIGIEQDPKFADAAVARLEAEDKGLDARDVRAGQLPMFEAAT